MNMGAVLEGLLFLRGDEGIKLSEIKDILNIDDNQLKDIIMRLQEEYLQDKHGIIIQKYGEYLKLVTKRT